MKRLDYYWYRQSPWLLLLWPVSLLFCLLVTLRRLGYRLGIFQSQRLAVPVIVVGNITVGGSGKTPLVLWLAALLQRHGYRPGLISRGYGGRAETWPQPVTAESDAELVGDEAVMLARNSGCPMVVGPDRVAAAELLRQTYHPDVIISDDGMQHYRLHRDIEIAVVDGERRLGNGMCLPAGPLREPASRLHQFDMVVSNGQPVSGEWAMTLHGAEAVAMQGTERRAITSFTSTPVHAVAGIGNPDRFFSFLRESGLTVIPHAFADHHPYSRGELDFADDYPVLMTEKDAVKCFNDAGERHWYVPVSAVLPDEFGNKVIALLEKAHG